MYGLKRRVRASYSNLEIAGDSKIVIVCHNKRINIPTFIMLLVEDILNLSQGLCIYDCQHGYREANTIVDCLAKKRNWYFRFFLLVVKFP